MYIFDSRGTWVPICASLVDASSHTAILLEGGVDTGVMGVVRGTAEDEGSRFATGRG